MTRKTAILIFIAAMALASPAWATLITASVNGPSGNSYAQFSLAAPTLVQINAPVDTGFSDPCLSASAFPCSYVRFEQSWIVGSGSVTISQVVVCLSQGNCIGNGNSESPYSLLLGPGTYQFVVTAADSANTGVQSVIGTLFLDDGVGAVPEPGAKFMAGCGVALIGIAMALRRRARAG